MAEISPDPALLLERSPGPELIAAEPPSDSHLVGGAVRDWLLASELAHDWDLVVDGEGATYAARLARRLGGRVVEPGGTRFAIHRVVAAEARIDIWDRRGTPLDAELARRDFTINSIALDLADRTLHDPLRGCQDLAAGRLRANRPETFRDDPLRILRLIRFELDLAGFEATDDTLAAARRAGARLPTVSAERIREELDRILSRRPAERLGGRLTELDLHPRLWAAEAVAADVPRPRRRGGEESVDAPDGDRRELTEPLTLADLDACLRRTEEAAEILVNEEDLVALRHAALLLTAGPSLDAASATPLLSRGWTSRRVGRRVDEILQHRDRPGDESEARLFLFRAGGAWPIVAAFDTWRASNRERSAWERLLEPLGELARREGRAIFDPPPLLRGDEIARRLGIEPGPELGRVVDRLRRLQITGRLRTADAARDWLAGRRGDLPPPLARE